MKEIKKKNWYVFYTSPRAEKKVNEYLLSLGYESFLPLKSEFKIWRKMPLLSVLPIRISIRFHELSQPKL